MKAAKLWGKSLAPLPAALVALLPSATCPACLGAYAGIVSALGIGFLFKEQALIPLIILFLVIAIGGAAWSMRQHRHPAPFVVTLAGAAAVIAGRLVSNVSAALYTGIALLALASVWNTWLSWRLRKTLVQLPSPTDLSNSRR